MKKILVLFVSIVLLLSNNIVFAESNYTLRPSAKNENKSEISHESHNDLYKLLPGRWEESYQYSRINVKVSTTFYNNGNYTDVVEIVADKDCSLFSKGQSESYQVFGKWWVENGYLHRKVEFSNNPGIAQMGQIYSSQIISVGNGTINFKHDYGVTSTSRKGVRDARNRDVAKFNRPLMGWDERDASEDEDEDEDEDESETEKKAEVVERTSGDIISRTFGDKGTSGSFLIDALNDMGVNIEEKAIYKIIKDKLLKNTDD